MGKAKHGRCKHGVRSALGSIGRHGAGTKEVRQRLWREIAAGLPSEKAAEFEENYHQKRAGQAATV